MQIRKSDFACWFAGLRIASYIAYPSSTMTVCPHIDNAVRCAAVENSKISFLLEYTFDGAATEFVCPLISLSRIYWPALERGTIAKLLSHGFNAF